MSNEMFSTLTHTPSQELRFEIFMRAAQRHQRAHSLRTGSMLAIAVVTLCGAAYAVVAQPNQNVNLAPLLYAISGFVSLVTLLNAWLLRSQRDGCWYSYCEYVTRTGGVSDCEVPPV